MAYATFFIGVLVVLLPSRVRSIAGVASPQVFGIPQILGVALVLGGAALVMTCILTFVLIGKGTQAEFDAPRHLVIRGPYRFVRNPMYIGLVGTLIGVTVYYGSVALWIYTVALWIIMHCRVIFFEEPLLARSFGDEYRDYRSRVARWLPRL